MKRLSRKEAMQLQLLQSTDKAAALALVLSMVAGEKPPIASQVVTNSHSPHIVEGPSPCEGCVFAERCRAQQLACGRFVRFVGGQEWTSVKPAPRRHVYKALFGAREEPAPPAEPVIIKAEEHNRETLLAQVFAYSGGDREWQRRIREEMSHE